MSALDRSGGVAARNGHAATVSLHLPDEPVARRATWRLAVLNGEPLANVVAGPGGLSEWLFARWRALEAVGIDEATLEAIALGYRRELWLWLAGERTWSQCCSGLIGRIWRRAAQAHA